MIKSPPALVQFEITQECNLNCIYCFNKKIKNEPSLENIEKVFRELSELGVFSIILTGGEPLLRADFNKIIEMANKYFKYKVLFTNGLKIDKLKKESFNRIIISVPSLDPEIYKKITGHDRLEKLIKNIANFPDKKKLELHVVASKTNLNYLQGIIDFANKMCIPTLTFSPVKVSYKKLTQLKNILLEGEDYELLFKLINKNKNISLKIGTPIPLCSYDKKNGTHIPFKKCNPGIGWCVINPNLDVLPCPHSEQIVGNINKEPFSDIWNRDFHCENNLNKKICKKCPKLKKCGVCLEDVCFKSSRNSNIPNYI